MRSIPEVSLGSPRRLLSAHPFLAPVTPLRRLIASFGDHLPSSAPKSPLCSGERLRLSPRGLVLGAMTVFDDVGSTGTRRSCASVSYSFIVQRVITPMFRTTGSQQVAVAGTSPIAHPIRHPSEIYEIKRDITRRVQRCWIDCTRAIDHIASHAIHRCRDRMGCRVHDDQLLKFQATGSRQSRHTDRAGARKRP